MTTGQMIKDDQESRPITESTEAEVARRAARQQLDDKVAAAEAEKKAAEAAKAAAEARKAAAEADLAAFKASVGEIATPPYKGEVELKADAGKTEAALLAAKAVRTAARTIADALERSRPADGKRVLIYSAADLPRFDLSLAFTAQTRLVGKAFDDANAADSAAEQADQAGTPPTTPFVTRGVPPVAAAGIALDAIDKLLGYFRTDYSVGGITLTVEDGQLIGAVADALRARDWDVRVPAVFDPEAQAAILTVLDEIKKLSLSSARGQAQRVRHERAANDLTNAAAKATPAEKPALLERARLHTEAATAWQTATTLFNAVYAKLIAADDKGVIPLATLARECSVRSTLEKGGRLLVVKVHTAGGAYYTKKSLWSLFLPGMPLYHMGGVVVTYNLFDGKTGQVRCAGVVPVHGGWVKASSVEAKLREVEPEPKQH